MFALIQYYPEWRHELFDRLVDIEAPVSVHWLESFKEKLTEDICSKIISDDFKSIVYLAKLVYGIGMDPDISSNAAELCTLSEQAAWKIHEGSDQRLV